MIKKIFEELLIIVQILLLMLLALYIFWETTIKTHIENYIKENYGYYIEQEYYKLDDLINDKGKS